MSCDLLFETRIFGTNQGDSPYPTCRMWMSEPGFHHLEIQPKKRVKYTKYSQKIVRQTTTQNSFRKMEHSQLQSRNWLGDILIWRSKHGIPQWHSKISQKVVCFSLCLEFSQKQVKEPTTQHSQVPSRLAICSLKNPENPKLQPSGIFTQLKPPSRVPSLSPMTFYVGTCVPKPKEPQGFAVVSGNGREHILKPQVDPPQKKNSYINKYRETGREI